LGDDLMAVGLASGLTRAGEWGPRGSSRPGQLFQLGPGFGPAVVESSPRRLHFALDALDGLSATIASGVDLLANPVAQRRRRSRLRRTGRSVRRAVAIVAPAVAAADVGDTAVGPCDTGSGA